ncbi:MAG: ParB/RepB/Spo0J family partition protein [Bacteroidetes bacterium]|jgi:ParB family chromosome partitioning protein|nr:ParB/RepB/Spo0J family partition protein [Bacteroidota bacterium]
MAKRQALGRGLSALLENNNSNAPVQVEENENKSKNKTVGNVAGAIALLRIADIEANPFQPRTHFDENALNDLAQSISELGIIQPITVRKLSAKKFQLISGERRFRASQIAELEEIPAYIRSADDQEMLEMALVENIQRENLDAIEVAISYKRLIEECQLTQDALSTRVGKNRSTISNYLRLLNLPAEIQVGIIEKQISMGHARALLTLPEPKNQKLLFERIIKEDLSVRKVEELVRNHGKEAQKPNKKTDQLNFEMQKLRADLRIRFGRAVQVKSNNDGSGKIEIGFKSKDDLQAILDALDEN